MHTVNLLTGLIENHQVWAYLIIFLGLVFEGEIIIISAGVLSHLGALSFPLALFFIILGGITKTVIGYSLGKYLYKKFNHNSFFRYIEKKVRHVVPRFNQKPFWSIFASKFIMGANNLVILYSGYKRINYKKYLKAEVLATMIWAPLMLTLGYAFSLTALTISKEIWKFSVIVLVLFILFFIFDKLAGMLYELFEEYKDGKQEQ
jgi:membrane-associated protein